MTNQIIKHGHYVPRVYLRKFADKNKRAYCLMKETEDIRQIKIDNICNENYMYAKENADGTRDLSLEKDFSSFEGTIPSTISEVENAISLSDNIDTKLKDKLIQATLLQLIRGQQAKSYISSTAKKKYNQFFNREDLILKYTHPSLYKEIKASEKIIVQNAPINTMREYLRNNNPSDIKKVLQLMQLKCIFSPNKELVTSDQPVVLYNSVTRSIGLFYTPLAYSKTIVYYPLTPHVAIVFYHKDKQTTSDVDSLCTITENDAVFLNQIQYRQSNHYIISKNKSALNIKL